MTKTLPDFPPTILADLINDPVVQMMMKADNVTADDLTKLVNVMGMEARPAPLSQGSKPSDYRPCVGIMLFNRNNRVFVGHRRKPKGANWQMPQGGVKEGETPRAAALRELKEETGISHVEIVAESRDWFYYDLPPKLVGEAWGGHWRGQKQKWFAMWLRGADAEVRVDGKEFDAWKWVKIADLAELIVSFKRAVYASVVDEFRRVAAIK